MTSSALAGALPIAFLAALLAAGCGHAGSAERADASTCSSCSHGSVGSSASSSSRSRASLTSPATVTSVTSSASSASSRDAGPGDGSTDAGTPGLALLRVTSSADPLLTLIPAFAPSTFDYYVQCRGHSSAPVANMLTVAVTATPGATASLSVATSVPTGVGPRVPVAAPATDETVTGSVENNQALVVRVGQGSAGGASVEYWVRCVPDDFPEMQWTPHVPASARPPGYYIFGTMYLPLGPRPRVGADGGATLAPEAPYAIVLDGNGVPVWYKYNPAFDIYDLESLAPGEVSFARRWEVDTIGGSVIYPVVDGVDGGHSLSPDDHELRLLPNGHYLGIVAAVETADLTGLTLPVAHDAGTVSPGANAQIFGCYVQEFDPSGTVYWRWSATDHFDPAKAMVVKGIGDLTGPPAQPFHCNSLDVDPVNGNILVSSRDMSSIFYVDRSSGKVLWKMGGSGAGSCYDEPVYVPVDEPFTAQHDARLQPGWKETCAGGSGQISLFDDESYTSNRARAVVFDVNIAGGCGDAGPRTGGTTGATRAWEYVSSYEGGAPTGWCGGFRISSDGSRVVGWGQSEPTPNGLVFSEVDEAGNDLLDLVCPDRSSTYRATKVPLSQFDLTKLRNSVEF